MSVSVSLYLMEVVLFTFSLVMFYCLVRPIYLLHKNKCKF